jgi:hypothetical protein
MCGSSATATASPGASMAPVIYSMPNTSKVLAMAAENADNATVSFTDNGSFYVSTITPPPGAKNGTCPDQVSLLGVSSVDGAITGVSVENFSMSPAAAGKSDQLSLVFRMTSPRQAAVQFVFDVNANSVVLNSATPVDETGKPLADGAALGLDFSTIWCVTRSGGTAILPALVGALPSLLGGPAAFLAAVTAAMPGAAIKTVQSVIANCFS